MARSKSRKSVVVWTSVPAVLAAVLVSATPSAQAAGQIVAAFVPASVFVVPDGVTAINVSLVASGGLDPFCSGIAGRGGAVSATLPVTPGETLQYNVANYFGPSASGNSSDIRRAPYGLDDRLLVAGGGGSDADFAGFDINGNCTGKREGPGLGGDGGSPAGLQGTGEDPNQCTFPAGHPGGGGQLDGPGVAGTTCGVGGAGAPGTFGHGGTGGGSGSAVAPCSQGGAGGDGWYGGGGGGGTGSSVVGSPGGCTDASGNPIAKTVGGGGGGGSSYADPSATNVVFTVGVNGSSLGSVSITIPTPATAPGPPASVTASASGTSATVTWTAPTDNGGSPVTGYQVTTIPGDAVATFGPSVLSTTFTGLTPTAQYSFEVTAVNAVGIGQPSAADVFGTFLTVKAAPTTVTYGSTTVVSGALKALSGNPVASRLVTVQRKPAGATTFAAVGTAVTNSSGVYSLSVKPTKGTTYRAVYAGGSTLLGASSPEVGVAVRPRVSISLNDSTATRTQTVTFSGVVAPNSPSQKVFLQRLVSGTWSTVKSTTLSSTSRYTFAWRPTSSVDYRFRVLVPARTGYVAGTSASKLLTVA